MKIVYRENIMTVFELRDGDPDIHFIIKYFMYNRDEVLYFVEDMFLRAVVSVGDIFRYLEGKKKNILNIDFTHISERDIHDADIFFKMHPTIHEVPLIDSKGHFIGIVKSENSNPQYLWVRFQNNIKELYFDLPSYYQKQLEKFMKYFKGQIFVIDLPDDNKVLERLHSNQEKEIFLKKRMISPLEQLQKMTEKEEKEYWGEAYEPSISEKFVKEFFNIKVLEKNGFKYYENSESSYYITFENGKRAVTNKMTESGKNLYLVGPCTIFGAYVTDNQTIEYYLQQLFSKSADAFQIVNWGSLGLGNEFQYLLTEPINDDDIVVLASNNKKLTSIMVQYDNSHYLGDYSDLFDGIENPMNCILDTFRHINYKISKEFARKMYEEISPYLISSNRKLRRGKRNSIQDYFISWDIVTYYKEFALNYNLNNLKGTIGAVVMNCNPFTKGHRHLIEYAAKKVDTLIVFVVEEDASLFPFADRIEMVKMGTDDILNVRVVPSGKYNISKSTFAQYFEKEKSLTKIDSMDYDLRIFCEVIADCMSISYRFAGEEPTDMVTKRYNERMEIILPQYNIKFIEIPRLKTNEVEYISASKVRQCLKNKEWSVASDFLPPTTIMYLKDRDREVGEGELKKGGNYACEG